LIFKKKSPLSLIHGKSLKGTLPVSLGDLFKHLHLYQRNAKS
jgi:hypothetical protein